LVQAGARKTIVILVNDRRHHHASALRQGYGTLQQ
jgi:hypothetical protein